ncbi:MAG TPA: hypothetical protein VJ749_03370 [Pyrinomonadaceae bacterium]|nr:hypothetical protein [Pyrinomonadaceae bacterium]
MALTGDEKRIQALFSETALQDRNAAPAFEELWASAAMKTSAPARSHSRPLLVVTAALLIAAVFWGAWYWSTRSSPQQAVNVAPQTVSPTAPQQVVQQAKQTPADVPVKFRPGRQNKRRIRQSDRPVIAEAALLSRWQSPTRSFMGSPATVDFSSLPQLNQSAEKLKQFLPRNTGLTKESNQ